MPEATSVLAFPYPSPTDVPDLNYWNKQLAQAVQDVLAGPWQAYAAGVSSVAGATTARYRKIGRTVEYRVDHVLSAAPTGNVTFALPAAPTAPPAGVNPSYGVVHGKDISAGQYLVGQAVWSGAGAVCRVMLSATSANPNLADVSAAVPIAWAAGDFLSIWGVYEAAA